MFTENWYSNALSSKKLVKVYKMEKNGMENELWIGIGINNNNK